MTSFPEHLIGQGVTLEAVRHDHCDGLLASMADPRVWRWMPARKPESRHDMTDWIDKWQQRREQGYGVEYAVLVADAVVGSIALYDYSPDNGTAESGWTWLAPQVWGTGVNRAMKVALYDYAFDGLGVVRLGVRTDSENIPAQRALEALGLHREGVLRSHLRRPDGTMRDTVYYSVLAHEWPSVRARWTATS